MKMKKIVLYSLLLIHSALSTNTPTTPTSESISDGIAKEQDTNQNIKFAENLDLFATYVAVILFFFSICLTNKYVSRTLKHFRNITVRQRHFYYHDRICEKSKNPIT